MSLDASAFLEGLAVEFEALKVIGHEKDRALVDVGVQVAKSLAPIGTGEEDIPGELRDSIGIIEETEDHIDWGTRLDYAPEVEYGNTKDKAQPFMRPAISRITRK